MTLGKYGVRLAALAVVIVVVSVLLSGVGSVNKEKSVFLAETERFVFEQLVMPNGGVKTNFLETEYTIDYATGYDVLSESQGLLMRYAVLTSNLELFTKALQYVEEKLLNEGVVAYRYSDEFGVFPVNAAIDDLRIIRALFEAAEVFADPDYREIAAGYGQYMYQSNVTGNNLVDYYDSQYKQQSSFLTLCYGDLATIRLLSELDQRWISVYESTLAVLQGGYISDEFPLFATSYDYVTGSYSTADITTCQSLIVAVHLAEIGACPDATVAFVKDLVSRGELYSMYDMSGAPLDDVHSTVNYALALILGFLSEDAELQQEGYDLMMKYWVEDKDSPVYGGFADVVTTDAYAFNNLYGLLAMLLMETDDLILMELW